ncbi:YceI family protein [Patescibacteria group bacterium]|nr:YceI family protein [Patescibacteria group bacterium]
MQKKTLGLLLVTILALLAIGGYAYFSKPVKAPTETPAQQQASAPTIQKEGNQAIYRIDPLASSASFSLGELLRGTQVTVVGTTSDVSGEIAADPASLSNTHIGEIRINARTLKTDSPQRNGAIARLILKSENNANEYITFKPTSVSGVPATATVGQSFPFETTGTLLISGASKEVTFKGTASFTSENELKGTAETMVHYADWNLNVPKLSFLANVDENTKLTINFVAKK